MKSINRIFAIATLAILFCANAIAQSVEPVMVASKTYLISNAAELQWFAEEVNTRDNTISCYLSNDIEYSGPQIGTRQNFPFQGVFDGCYYNVTLDMDCKDTEYAGLFQYVGGENATIKNLNLLGNLYSYGQYSGCLVGCVPSNNVNINRVLVDVNCHVKTASTDIDKYCAGFIGRVFSSATYKVEHCGFVGTVTEVIPTDETLNLCGVVGKDERQSAGSSVAGTFMYASSSFDIVTDKDNVYVYPVGDLFAYTQKKVTQYYTVLSNINYLDSEKFSYTYPAIYTTSGAIYGADGSEFEEGDILSYLNPEEGTYSYETDLVWEQEEGSSYPTLKVPTVEWEGNNDVASWANSGNWVGHITPNWSTNVRFPSSAAMPSFTIGGSARKITIDAGASVTMSGSSFVRTKDIIIDGSLIMGGSSTLESKNVSVAGTLQLTYDYLKNSPSLIYTGAFTGKAKLVREFKPNYLMYLGAGIEECAFDVNTYGKTAFFDTSVNKYTTLDWLFNGYDLENGDYFSGDITTGRVIRLYEENGNYPILTEIGTPVSSSKKFVVNKLTSGYVALNNPYPYTIDVSQWANKVGTTVAWRVLNGSEYSTVTYNTVGGASNNADPYIAPFKTVTYQVPEGVTSLVLPNVSSRGENHQMLKSASLRDDMIKIQLFVNESSVKSDEGTLLFMNVGSKDTDTDNLDSSVGDLYSDETGKVASPKVVLHKLTYNEGLSIAIYPEAQNMIGVELPVEVILPDYGVKSLKISGFNVNNFNYDYGVYFCDKLKQQMVNLREEPYEVTDLENMPSNRFCVILVNSGDTPVIPEYVEEEIQIPTSIEVSNTGTDLDGVIIRSENGKVIVNNVPDQLVGSPIDVYNTLGVKVSTKEADIDNTIDAGGTGIRAVVVNNSQAKKILVK